jgi:F0F1-type ATP synthase membrane subunit b/b'
MAQWWELAIPAAATLIGGFAAAWWQAQAADRQLRAQSRLAAQQRLFEQRLRAYRGLSTACWEALAAARSYQEYTEQLADNPESDALKEGRQRIYQELYQLTEQVRKAVTDVSIIGAEKLVDAAWQVADQLTPAILSQVSDYPQILESIKEFQRMARLDLGRVP